MKFEPRKTSPTSKYGFLSVRYTREELEAIQKFCMSHRFHAAAFARHCIQYCMEHYTE